MKRILFLIMLAVCVFGSFAIDFNRDNFSVYIDIGEYIVVTSNKIYRVSMLEEKPVVLDEINRPQFIINKYGYASIKMRSSEYFLINFNGYIIPVWTYENEGLPEEPIGFMTPISISASSEYSEFIKGKKIIYKAQYPFYRLCREKESGTYLMMNGFPWVPDVKNDPDMYIEFETDEGIEYLAILPGYVDFKKQHLFSENPRIKNIEVLNASDGESLGIYTLVDKIEYCVIKIPAAISKIKIRIKDCYSGTKYNDPCITSIGLDQYMCHKPGDYGRAIIKQLLNEKIINN